MALLIACVRPPAAFAETPVPDADVAIIARSLDAAPNTKLRDIITFAASLRLDRNGLASVVIAEPPKAAANPGTTLALPESRGANHLLLIESSENATTLSLHIAWYDRASDKPIAESHRSGPEDMQMDELIFDAIGDILDRVAAVAPITPKAMAVADSPKAAMEPSKAAGRVSSSRGLELGFGSGPFLAGGALGSYFKAAGGLQGRATWYFPAGTFAFGLGISIEGTLFRAAGPLESVTGVIAPLALDFRFAAPAARGQLLPYIHAAVGAALMSLQTPIYGSQSSFLPYAGAGIGLGWVLGSGLSLSLDLSYRLFLDGSDLLSGFDPQFAIGIPLGKRQ